MGNAHPVQWARDRRRRLEQWAKGDVGRWTREALAVCLPGVPLAAMLGFFANNGVDQNTTGWKSGDESERAKAVERKRFPLKRADPSDAEVYGHIGSDDLHELGPGGVEGNRCPAPVATGACPWVSLATSAEVVKVLGREGVTGAAWYGAHRDQCVIGVANVARHLRAIRARLDARLQWDDLKPLGIYAVFCGMSSWSAGGGRMEDHLERHAEHLAPLPEHTRVGEFLRLAGAVDDRGGRHREDEYTAIRWGQKREAMILAAQWTGEDVSWFGDGLSDADRAEVYARLVAVT